MCRITYHLIDAEVMIECDLEENTRYWVSNQFLIHHNKNYELKNDIVRYTLSQYLPIRAQTLKIMYT